MQIPAKSEVDIQSQLTKTRIILWKAPNLPFTLRTQVETTGNHYVILTS